MPKFTNRNTPPKNSFFLHFPPIKPKNPLHLSSLPPKNKTKIQKTKTTKTPKCRINHLIQAWFVCFVSSIALFIIIVSNVWKFGTISEETFWVLIFITCFSLLLPQNIFCALKPFFFFFFEEKQLVHRKPFMLFFFNSQHQLK